MLEVRSVWPRSPSTTTSTRRLRELGKKIEAIGVKSSPTYGQSHSNQFCPQMLHVM